MPPPFPPLLRTRPALWLLLPLLVGCGPKPNAEPHRERPLVVTSFFPLYDFARRIAGDFLEVRCLVPPGADPHAVEASPSAARAIADANLLFLLGLGMDGWVEKLARSEPNLRQVTLSEGLPTRPHPTPTPAPTHPTSTDHPTPHAHPPHHPTSSVDPHLWLDPDLAIRIARRIGRELALLAPAHRTVLEQRTADLEADLHALDSEFASAIAQLPRREVVTFHGAFSYLFARYHLRVAAVVEPFPGSEPSAADLRHLVDLTRRLGIRTIMAEPQLPERSALVIAREIGGTVERLDPCETILPDAPNASYLDRQRRNLRVLCRALGTNAPPSATPDLAPSSPRP